MDNEQEYSILTIDDELVARQCSRMIAEEFAESNPFSIYCRSTAELLFDDWLWPLMMEVIKQQLSFYVRHNPSGDIVAAVIAQDLYINYKQQSSDASFESSRAPVTEFFHRALDEFIEHDLDQSFQCNTILWITAGATRSAHSGKGIAGQLRNHLCNYAKKIRLFQYAFVQTAHPATRHIYLNRMNGEAKSTIHPAKWLWKTVDHTPMYPFQDYQGEPITNILLRLT